MRITVEVLEQLGAVKEGETYMLKECGILTTLKPDRTARMDDGGMLWILGHVAGGHHVTHLEEVIAWSYLDGLEEGKEAKQQEIKEVLGIKDAID